MPQPLAVDPSNPKPGLYLTVDLLRGTSSPGAAGLRCLMISPPASGQGNITIGTELRPVYSAEDVETAIGRGPGYFAYKTLVANDPLALVDLVACAESAGAAATQTLTFAGTPTSNMTFGVYISGVLSLVAWNVGDANTLAKTNGVSAINQNSADLPAVASAGAGGVINLTARSKGPAGNDIPVRVVTISGAGGTLTAGGATLTGGTTEVDLTTALQTASVREYDFILPCLSAVDAQSATGNTQKIATHIDTYKAGSSAKLQQCVYGSNGTIAAAKTNTVARNNPNLEHVLGINYESLPCEIAAAELGDRMRRRRREINANRVLQPLKRLRGAADVAANTPSDPMALDALSNGVTLLSYTAQGDPMVMRSITTHSQDTLGNPDKRCYDTNEPDSLYDYAKDLRAAVPAQFIAPDGQVKIAKNRQEGDEDLPAGVVEERDVKAFIVQRTLAFWVPKGVIDGVAFQSTVDDGSLAVTVNASDPNQVDVFIPAKVFKILAKIGLYIAKVG